MSETETPKQLLERSINSYREQMVDVANMLAKLKMYSDQDEYWMNKFSDNGDPFLESEEARLKVGDFLSALVCYWAESIEELEKIEKEKSKK